MTDQIFKRAVLIKTDIPTKQLILHLNEQLRLKSEPTFIVEDLDDTHLLIKADYEQTLREDIEALYNRNVYERIS